MLFLLLLLPLLLLLLLLPLLRPLLLLFLNFASPLLLLRLLHWPEELSLEPDSLEFLFASSLYNGLRRASASIKEQKRVTL